MWYIYTMEYYSAIKKEWNLAICSNMDRPVVYYAKWNRKKQIPYYFTYMKSRKQNKWTNKMKEFCFLCEKQTHRYREEMGGCHRGGGSGTEKIDEED